MFALLPFCQVRFVKSALSKTCIHCDISVQFQFYKNICCTFNFSSTFLACDSIVSSPSFKRELPCIYFLCWTYTYDNRFCIRHFKDYRKSELSLWSRLGFFLEVWKCCHSLFVLLSDVVLVI